MFCEKSYHICQYRRNCHSMRAVKAGRYCMERRHLPAICQPVLGAAEARDLRYWRAVVLVLRRPGDLRYWRAVGKLIGLFFCAVLELY